MAQQLNFLKAINDIQRDGSLQNLLLSVKQAKADVEAYSKALAQQRAKLEKQRDAEQKQQLAAKILAEKAAKAALEEEEDISFEEAMAAESAKAAKKPRGAGNSRAAGVVAATVGADEGEFDADELQQGMPAGARGGDDFYAGSESANSGASAVNNATIGVKGAKGANGGVGTARNAQQIAQNGGFGAGVGAASKGNANAGGKMANANGAGASNANGANNANGRFAKANGQNGQGGQKQIFSQGANQGNNFRKFDANEQNRFARGGQNAQRGGFGGRYDGRGGANSYGATSGRNTENGQGGARFGQRLGQGGNFQNGNFQNRQNGARGGQGGKNQGGFVSTRANNFKSFGQPTESSSVLATPERSYGNKNKQRRNVDETKKVSAKQRGGFDKHNNILVMDDEGFEETTMGSRKLIKKKKETAVVVAPKVTSAVLTSREVTVKELSEKIGKPVAEIVKKLMLLGVMATINSTIDFDTCELVASELGVTLELKPDKTFEEKLLDVSSAEDDDKDLQKRPPVVTVMGHVDHGKTSLLDAFRKTNVVSGEAGGITQKIGAYQISFNGEKITFLDTPGHAAFTSMRARGAEVTDIAILVVAADDGIMPQTIEAINHIKAAKVPMIVAINKMDKPEANADRVKQQLAENNVLPEEWGGDAICVPISAKTGMGLDELKKMILLVAEMQELRANPNKMATGTVIEAELDKTRGPVATVLVQNGTLKIGDSIMSGITYGKVKAMFDENGKPMKKAPPSTPVAVMGFNDVPNSGDAVYAVEESLSKQVINERINKMKLERARHTSGVSADDFMNRVHEGNLKALNIIIKADTQGSVEALRSSLEAIRNDEVKVVCLHSAAGAITESDVLLAQTTGATIVAFNLKTSSKVQQMIDSLKVQMIDSKIIYEIVDQITRLSKGMMAIKYEEKYIGTAEVRVVFKLSTAGKVAGSYVTDGKITRGAIVKIKRGDEEIATSSVASLKIVKDEKSEVAKGFECGIKLADNMDFAEGDVLECYVKQEIKQD